MKQKIIFLVLTVLLFGCKDDFNTLKPQLIGSGTLSGFGDEKIPNQNLVINDSLVWIQLMNQMNSVKYNDSTVKQTDKLIETNVDFKKYTVIACFDDTLKVLRYLEIGKILEYEKNIIVSINHVDPLPGPYVIHVSQPFYIAKINKTYKTILFENK
jgi:hypothetical protein